MKPSTKDKRSQPQLPVVYVRIDPDNPRIAHLSDKSSPRQGPTYCKLKPDNTVAVITDSKSLTRENIYKNCNAIVRKRVRRKALKV